MEQGDTLFGIALEYGVTVEGLLRANALDEDQYLRIGQGLIIPLEEEAEPMEMVSAAPVGNSLLPTPTPLPLQTSGIALYETPVGGLWCMGEVLNTTGQPVTNVQVSATLVGHDGTSLATVAALVAADYLPVGERAPFAVLFKEPPAGAVDVRLSLLRGESVGAITAGFVPLPVSDLQGGISGPQYRVSGLVTNDAGVEVSRVVVVVTLYDAEEQVLGYRQVLVVEEEPLSPGEERSFQVLLTPQGLEQPESFHVLAWGSRVE